MHTHTGLNLGSPAESLNPPSRLDNSCANNNTRVQPRTTNPHPLTPPTSQQNHPANATPVRHPVNQPPTHQTILTAHLPLDPLHLLEITKVQPAVLKPENQQFRSLRPCLKPMPQCHLPQSPAYNHRQMRFEPLKLVLNATRRTMCHQQMIICCKPYSQTKTPSTV